MHDCELVDVFIACYADVMSQITITCQLLLTQQNISHSCYVVNSHYIIFWQRPVVM